MARILSLLIVVWLVIGAFAAYQRDYFADTDTSCAEAGNIALTVVAGPLNYLGVNPEVDCSDVDVDVPEPSK
ncbi:hypothetical protein [Nocardioides sp. P5_C9_2]